MRTHRTVLLAGLLLAALAVVPHASAAQTVVPGSLPDGGLVRLHLVSSSSGSYLRYDAPDGSGGYTAGAAAAITANQQCKATTSGAMDLVPQPVRSALGLVGGSLGVQVRGEGNGQPCGRVDGLDQALELTPAAPTPGSVMDFAELDVEGKFDVTIRAELYLGAALQRVETLPTGTGSDSGPDSADGDNYRWRIPAAGAGAALFDRIVLRVDPSTPGGGFSLEGGADGTAPEPGGLGEALGTSDSLFHLVDADGILDCGDEVVEAGGGVDPTATLTRLENLLGGPADCVPIPYLLRTGDDGPAQYAELRKDLGDQAALVPAFRLTIAWTPEVAAYPVARTTQIDTGSGPHDMVWCDGTPAAPTIPAGELWCLTGQQTTTVGNGLIQVTEDLYGAGDPRWTR